MHECVVENDRQRSRYFKRSQEEGKERKAKEKKKKSHHMEQRAGLSWSRVLAAGTAEIITYRGVGRPLVDDLPSHDVCHTAYQPEWISFTNMAAVTEDSGRCMKQTNTFPAVAAIEKNSLLRRLGAGSLPNMST